MARALGGIVRWGAKIGAGMAMAAALAACTPSLSGGPQRVFSESAQLDFVRKQFPLPDMATYVGQGEAQRRAFRNEYVLAQVYAMDVNYGVYEAALTREMQAVGFGSTVANIALTSVASQISPVGTKDILTATAAGLSGVRASYEKDILVDRTIQIIQSQMRASRARVATRILTRLKLSADDYPLMMAWIDLQDYYTAGTFTDGLVEVRQTIGEQAIMATTVRDTVVVEGTPASNPEIQSLNLFLRAGNARGNFDRARYGYLQSLLSNGAGVLLDYFQDPSIRSQLARCAERYLRSDPCARGSIRVPQ